MSSIRAGRPVWNTIVGRSRPPRLHRVLTAKAGSALPQVATTVVVASGPYLAITA
jgi:hypothetical protein